MPFVRALLSNYYKAEQQPPVAILIQYNQVTKNYNLEFEDFDEARWKLTPSNAQTLSKEIWPTPLSESGSEDSAQ